MPNELKPTAKDFQKLNNNIEKSIKENDNMLLMSNIYASNNLPCGNEENERKLIKKR